VLKRILEFDRPEILDLGPLCGHTVVYLADKGARVSVDEYEPPPPTPPRDPKQPASEEPPGQPLRIEQGDGTFHLVLAWEHFDFTPPERLRDFGGEIQRVLADGGYVLLFAQGGSVEDAPEWHRPGRFRLLADDRLVREDSGPPNRKRWVHPTREIERSLGSLAIQGVHLQRNQVREFLAQKSRR
jgi:hypothetical protein